MSGTNHMEHLGLANAIRCERAAVKAKLRTRDMTILEALQESCCAKATLYSLLVAQKRWGDAKAMGLYSRLNRRGVAIGMHKRVCELTERQLSALREELR